MKIKVRVGSQYFYWVDTVVVQDIVYAVCVSMNGTVCHISINQITVEGIIE